MTTAYESGNVPDIEVRHRLRIAREYAHLEQQQLAELIGVSRNTVVNAEKGNREPRKIVVNAWALACGVPASWIWTGNISEGPGGGDGGGGTDKTVGYLTLRRPPAPIIPLQRVPIVPLQRVG